MDVGDPKDEGSGVNIVSEDGRLLFGRRCSPGIRCCVKVDLDSCASLSVFIDLEFRTLVDIALCLSNLVSIMFGEGVIDLITLRCFSRSDSIRRIRASR